MGLDFLRGDAIVVAQMLVGWRLYRVEADGTKTGGTIIETEAYHQDDEASHSFRGKTARNAVMFGPAGHLYVYFTYGMHWCVNIVTGKSGNAQAVLVRALLPDSGIELMRKRRGGRSDAELANGPAKLCQALGLTGADNGTAIGSDIILLPPLKKYHVTATPRIGISQNKDALLRFVASS